MSSETTTTLETTLRGREDVAEGTMAFHFAKPDGFEFRPGQAIELLLPDPGGAPQDIGHAISIVSAPHEDAITIATSSSIAMSVATHASIVMCERWLCAP